MQQCGFCETRENAVIAATKHIVNDGYSRYTITDRETKKVVARLSLSADRRHVVINTVAPFRR